MAFILFRYLPPRSSAYLEGLLGPSGYDIVPSEELLSARRRPARLIQPKKETCLAAEQQSQRNAQSRKSDIITDNDHVFESSFSGKCLNLSFRFLILAELLESIWMLIVRDQKTIWLSFSLYRLLHGQLSFGAFFNYDQLLLVSGASCPTLFIHSSL